MAPNIFDNFFFRKKVQNNFVNILELVLFYVLNTFEPLGIPKNPQKEQKDAKDAICATEKQKKHGNNEQKKKSLNSVQTQIENSVIRVLKSQLQGHLLDMLSFLPHFLAPDGGPALLF